MELAIFDELVSAWTKVALNNNNVILVDVQIRIDVEINLVLWFNYVLGLTEI